MTPYTLSFTLLGLPKATNQMLGGSRWVKHKNAQLWKRSVALAVRGKLPPAPLKQVQITLVRYNYRTLDYDGLVASFKPVVDGLVEAGVLQNDTWKITGAWDVRQEYAAKADAFVAVTVTETIIPKGNAA